MRCCISAASRLHLAGQRLAHKAAKLAKITTRSSPVLSADEATHVLDVDAATAAVAAATAAASTAAAATAAGSESAAAERSGEVNFSVAAMAMIRGRIEALRSGLAKVPSDSVDALLPPPILLSAADAAKHAVGIPELLGGTLVLPALHQEESVPSTSGPTAPAAPSPMEVERVEAHAATALGDYEVLGLLFAAEWCTSCKAVESQLVRTYRSLRTAGKALQMVTVHCDNSTDEYEQHRSRLPWPSLPFGSLKSTDLATQFHVSAIPTVVLLTSDGTLISSDGLRLLRGHSRSFPWSAELPPETPHHHPFFDRLLRRKPVHAGAITSLGKVRAARNPRAQRRLLSRPADAPR